MMFRNMLVLLPLLAFGAGCSTTLTNLTPKQQVRNANGLYPLEVAWDSRQGTVKQETIRGSVVVGLDIFPMKPTPMLKNRWEVLVPIPPDKTFINYRFKFDYDYRRIPEPRASSKLSTPYRLDIIEK